jgi:hypothetical protein
MGRPLSVWFQPNLDNPSPDAPGQVWARSHYGPQSESTDRATTAKIIPFRQGWFLREGAAGGRGFTDTNGGFLGMFGACYKKCETRFMS